jgi:hypothetical protein
MEIVFVGSMDEVVSAVLLPAKGDQKGSGAARAAS